MAKTVGLTAAAGVELMLSAQRPRGGTLHCFPFDIPFTALCTESDTIAANVLVGVHIPTEAAVYEPVLQALAAEGLGFHEESVYSAA